MRIPNRIKNKEDMRIKRKIRIRKKLSGTAAKPRIAIYRSLNHLYAQVIDDVEGVTLLSTSTNSKDLRDQLKGLKKSEKAKKVGEKLAELCKEKKIETAVFDRGGYKYHGRIKALADGAREGGLKI